MTSAAVPAASRLEVGLLAALLLSVPLFEVPKQLLWAAWVTVSLGGMWRQHRAIPEGERPRARWRGWDAVLAVFVVTSFLAGAGYAPAVPSLLAAGDAARMMVVPWLMMRRGYGARQAVALLWAMLAGTVLAAVWGGWMVAIADPPRYLELNSVGHVNHSAIYLAIALGGALGLALAHFAPAVPARDLRDPAPGEPLRRDRSWRWAVCQSPGRAGLALAAALLLAVALLVTGSRAAVGAITGFVVLLLWFVPVGDDATPEPSAWRRRLRLGLIVLLLLAATGYRLALGLSDKRLNPPGGGLLEKFDFQSSAGAPTSYRDGLLRLAWAGASAHPWFGVGNRGFRLLTPEWSCREQHRRHPATPCDNSTYFFSTHAHNLYANTLAERGVLGLLGLLGLLGAWAWALRGSLAWARIDPHRGAVWVASLAGWSVTVLAGLLNTTLHHEHGLLAMVLLGLLLSARGRRPAGVIGYAGNGRDQRP